MSASTKNVITEDGIAFSKLEETAARALAADEKYRRENDAKFRAVAQKVGTYEEFEELVKGSHIKPMTEDITNLSLTRSSWVSGRTVDRERKKTIEQAQQKASATAAEAPKEPPATMQIFLRDWRKMAKKPDERKNYLFMIGTEKLAELFKVEIGHGLLGEMLVAFADSFQGGEASQVLDFLGMFSKRNRFALAVEFLSDAEVKATSRLFEALEGTSDERVGNLKSLYILSN